jgi:hypothetical protein
MGFTMRVISGLLRAGASSPAPTEERPSRWARLGRIPHGVLANPTKEGILKTVDELPAAARDYFDAPRRENAVLTIIAAIAAQLPAPQRGLVRAALIELARGKDSNDPEADIASTVGRQIHERVKVEEDFWPSC